MKGEKMYSIISNIDSDIVEEATNYKPKKSTSRFLRSKWIAVAACLVLLISTVSGLTIYAEAKKYEAAISFFNEYSLTTEGLSRGEIMSIYRDITTNSFSYGKTAEVIQKSVGGYEILQENPTPDDLENLWNYRNSSKNLFNHHPNAEGVLYQFDYVEKYDDELKFDVHDKIIFTKSVDGKVAWSVDILNMVHEGYLESNDFIIVFGSTPSWSSANTTYGRIAMISKDGELIWDKTTSNGFKREYVSSVVYSENSLAVFSRGDLKYLCFTKFDMNGNSTGFTKTEVGNYGIRAAAKLGDGFLIQLNHSNTGDLLMKIAADGTVEDSFTYTSDKDLYFITDMIEYNGNIYLSAHSVPKLDPGESNAGGRDDIARVLNEIFNRKDWDIPNTELTELMRNNFTAALLVCDPASGIPQTFYTVKGSFGARLSISEEGSLLWNVESITDSFFSPMTSSFSIGGVSYVYKYAFDSNGKITSQEKTGEIVQFRK
jgi:hypothetical protein